jgi:phosphate uptake regulator
MSSILSKAMKRKVIKHGPSTLIVSLPCQWAKEHKVTKGSEVDIAEDGEKIIISLPSSVQATPSEVNIDVTGLDRTSLMYAIRSLYRLGYDTIKVRFHTEMAEYYRTKEKMTVISVLHKEVSRLVSFEIIQEGKNFCIIKDLGEASVSDFNQIERRIFHLILDACNQLKEGAKSQNKALLATLEERHDTITKFVSYCLRLMNKKSNHILMPNAYHYHIVATLDRITDIIKYAGRDIQLQRKVHPDIIALLDAVCKHLHLYYELFYSYRTDKLVEISLSRYGIHERLSNLPKKVEYPEKLIAMNVGGIADLILDLVEARTALEYSLKN